MYRLRKLIIEEYEKITMRNVADPVKFWALYATSFYERLFKKIKNLKKLDEIYSSMYSKLKKEETKKALNFFYRLRKAELKGEFKWENKMKKSELRNIIKEEIKSVLTENAAKDLEKLMKSHNWKYEDSHDDIVYNKGEKELQDMYNLMRKVHPDISKPLWTKYAPKKMKFINLYKEGYSRGTSWGDEKRQEKADNDAYERGRRSFRSREMNVGVEDEDPGDRNYIKSMKGLYVKMKRGGGYMPALYHEPSLGPTDGKLYRKNKKTGGYFPTRK